MKKSIPNAHRVGARKSMRRSETPEKDNPTPKGKMLHNSKASLKKAKSEKKHSMAKGVQTPKKRK